MKEKLLRLVDVGRRKEAETLVPDVNDSEPANPGEWTTKDVLAHMTAWRNVAVGELEAILDGSPVPEVSTEDDVENAKFYAQTHPLPSEAILQAAAQSWDDLAAAIRRCTEEQLQVPRPRRPEQQLWLLVPNNTYFHMAQHLDWWFTSRGDEASAEAASVWGYRLQTDTFPEDRQRGVAEYNLACFFGRRGNVEKALPHLRLGFELRPDLREFAKEDTDLESIRTAPEVTALLGG